MKKIFKYKYDSLTGKVTMPESGIVLRTDFVEGEFLWAIVDTLDPLVERRLNLPLGWSLNQKPENQYKLNQIRLKVKEKQEFFGFKPLYAKEKDGEMFVYTNWSSDTPVGYHKVAVYKTGQEIIEPIEELTYLGLNRLWIIQELGLYTFLHEVQ